MTSIVLMTMDKWNSTHLPYSSQNRPVQAIRSHCRRRSAHFAMDRLHMNCSYQHLRRHFHCNCLYLHCVVYGVSEYCHCSNCCGLFHFIAEKWHGNEKQKIKLQIALEVSHYTDTQTDNCLTSFDYFDDVYSLRPLPRHKRHSEDYLSDRSHVVLSVGERNRKIKRNYHFYLGIPSAASTEISEKFKDGFAEYNKNEMMCSVRTGLFGECCEVPSDSLLSDFNGLMVISTSKAARTYLLIHTKSVLLTFWSHN